MKNKPDEFTALLGRIFKDEIPQNEDYSSVKTITFQVTQDCSLRCSYCYQHTKNPNYMTFDVAKKTLDYIFDNKENPNFYFNQNDTRGIILDFIGGEPLLAIDLIHQIVEYFEYRCDMDPDCPWGLYHAYCFSTNGVHLFEPRVQEFLNKYGVETSMSVTLDGCEELHDRCRKFPNGDPSYKLAEKAAMFMLERGHDATKVTLAPANIGYVYEAFKNLVELGFTNIHMNSCFEEGWKKEHALVLFDQLKKIANYLNDNNLNDDIYFILLSPISYRSELLSANGRSLDHNWCGTNKSMLAVDYKGDLFTCVRFIENCMDGKHPDYIIGNVENGIGHTPDEAKRLDDLNKLTASEQSTEECWNCPIKSGCSWCTAYNYEHFGTICKRSTYHCLNHIAGALASMYYYKLINDKASYDIIKLTKEYALKLVDEKTWDELQWEE